jgi:hypothetical protein
MAARPGLGTADPVRSYADHMTDETTAEELRRQLKGIDEELAELRRVTDDAQARRGEDTSTSEGFLEPEDIATNLTSINESEAVIDVLEQRRERAQAKLDALGTA